MKRYYRYCIAAVIFFAASPVYGQQKFTGTFSNGCKGAKLNFILSADKRSISNFSFTGYWRCAGSTENTTAGPKQSFPVVNGKVDALLTDPGEGGSSASRFN